MRRILVVILTSLFLTAAVFAAEKQQPSKVTTGTTAAVASRSNVQTNAQTAEANRIAQELRANLNREIQTRTEAEQVEVAALVTELEMAITSAQRQEVQGRIQTAKAAGRRDLLVIQLDYAQQGGYTDQAREIEDSLQKMDESTTKSLPQSSAHRSLQDSDSK